MKYCKKLLAALVLLAMLLLTFASCEIEMEEKECSHLVKDVEATVWKNDAASVSDLETESLSANDLEKGTDALRVSSLRLNFKNNVRNGYEWLYCDFNIKPSADVQLLIKVYTRDVSGETTHHGDVSCTLTAGEVTHLSLPFYADDEIIDQDDFVMELEFESVLPFLPAEDEREEGVEYVELSTFAAITYEISELKFYGAQTTAT